MAHSDSAYYKDGKHIANIYPTYVVLAFDEDEPRVMIHESAYNTTGEKFVNREYKKFLAGKPNAFVL